MIQGSIDCFYSEEKARLKYSHFLHDYTAQIEYEGRKPQSEKRVIQSITAPQAEYMVEDGESGEANFFFEHDKSHHYLRYDVEELMGQL
jgi:hypothetical protein